MGRIVAIDYGLVRTGVAVSDEMQLIATPLQTVETKNLFEWLKIYLARENVSEVVIGRPTRVNGEPSSTLPQVEAFGEAFSKMYPHIALTFYDERFTSVLAHRAMDATLRKKARRDKQTVDKIAACIILEGYMDFKKI